MEQVSFVDGYYVGFRELPSGGPYVYKTVNIKQGQADANYTLVGLKRGTQYSIVVQAFNSQGAGPPSDEIIVQTSTIGKIFFFFYIFFIFSLNLLKKERNRYMSQTNS